MRLPSLWRDGGGVMLICLEKIKQSRWKDLQSLRVKEDEVKIEMTGNRMWMGGQNWNSDEAVKRQFEMAQQPRSWETTAETAEGTLWASTCGSETTGYVMLRVCCSSSSAAAPGATGAQSSTEQLSSIAQRWATCWKESTAGRVRWADTVYLGYTHTRLLSSLGSYHTDFSPFWH